jgi:hypothetical protein
MSFALKFDANNQPVTAIEEIIPVKVAFDTTGIIDVSVPARSFAVAVKRVATAYSVEININDTGFFPLDEGDQFGNFLDLRSIQVRIEATDPDGMVLLFSR